MYKFFKLFIGNKYSKLLDIKEASLLMWSVLSIRIAQSGPKRVERVSISIKETGLSMITN